MTEHRRNILITDCIEANAHYLALENKHYQFHGGTRTTSIERTCTTIATAYLMRAEALTK